MQRTKYGSYGPDTDEASDNNTWGSAETLTFASPTSPSGSLPGAPAVPAAAEATVTFISGVTSNATVANTAYWSWDGNNPATYGRGANDTLSGAAKWDSTTLSQTGTAGGTVTFWFDASAGTTAEQNAYRAGLDLWAALANISFQLAADQASADIIFRRAAGGSSTSAHSPTATIGSGTTGAMPTATITIDSALMVGDPSQATAFNQGDGYVYDTIVHEIGHALGLGHAGPYNASDPASLGTPESRQFSVYDSRLWTLMSYIDPTDTTARLFNSYPVTGTDWNSGSPADNNRWPTTPMMLDIQAIQRIYGAPTTGALASGNVTFGFNSDIPNAWGNYFDFRINQHPIVTLWARGSANTLDLSGFATPSIVNLNPGSFSSADNMVNNIAIAPDTRINTAIGGRGADTINGNSAANRLIGNDGDDKLNGGGGDDDLFGGLGHDTFDGGPANDTAVYSYTANRVTAFLGSHLVNGQLELPGATVRSPSGFVFDSDTFISIEHVTGGGGNDQLNGNDDSNIIKGAGGADTITGGLDVDVLQGGDQNDFLKGGGGADVLDGGNGTDIAVYVDSSTGVTVNLLTNFASGGTAQGDTFANVETIIGSPFGDVLIGNNLANRLRGDIGKDTLKGGGGVDFLEGDGDDDVLAGQAGSDTLDGGAGFDTADYTLTTAGVTVFTGPHTVGGTGFTTGTADGSEIGHDTLRNIENVNGGSGPDTITGDAGANRIRGGGGTDAIEGNLGIDTADYSDSSQGVTVFTGPHQTGPNQFSTVGTANGPGIGSDTLRGIENVIGGSGNDTITGTGVANSFVGGLGNDNLDGGLGIDTADYSDSTQGVTVFSGPHQTGPNQFSTVGTANGPGIGSDTLRGIENVIGGSGNDTITGTGAANSFVGGLGNDNLDGGLGIDTADYSDSTQGVTVFSGPHQTGPNQFSTVGTANGPGIGSDTLRGIENVIGGSGNDTITGTGAANSFVGGLGNDNLDGGLGIDTADYSDSTQGVTVFSGPHQTGPNQFSTVGTANGPGIGSDTLRGIENVIGGSGNDKITGDGSANTFAGGGGTDSMDGGAGFDFVDYSRALGAVVVDLGPTSQQDTFGAGLDTLRNFEGIIGSRFDDILLRGFASSVILRGGLGNDRFHDHNAGSDTFDGGLGVNTIDYSTGGLDSVVVNLTTDRATSVGGSINTLISIQNATGSQGDDRLIGDDLVNVLTGAGGKDILDGNGGVDTMAGGAGNDRYFVDNGADKIVEASNQGDDSLNASASYSLGAGISLETMRTINASATNAINLAGNEIANTLEGNAGVNTLNGRGGADTMRGFAGSDTYFADSSADTIIEAANGGSDTVIAVASYTLRAGASVEKLQAGGTAAVTLVGNALGQTLEGNDATNSLFGKAGKDTLTGGLGNDFFTFDTAPSAANVDDITDFSVAADTVRLENAAFAGLGTATGTLAAAKFFKGAAAHDADDRIIYNAATGALMYDSNGNAAGGSVQFATLAKSLVLTNADFVVI